MTVEEIAADRLVTAAQSAEDIIVADDEEAMDVDSLRCAICGIPAKDAESLPVNYSNPVCDACDRLAVNDVGNDPWHGWPPGEEPDSEDGVIQMAPDHGENPVYILGVQCWRRYRFGGWVTRRDAFDCDTLEEFQHYHRIDSTWLHAFDTPQPEGVDVSRSKCQDIDELHQRLEAIYSDARSVVEDANDETTVESLEERLADCDVALPESAPDSTKETRTEYARAVQDVIADRLNEQRELKAFCERYFEL